MNTHPTTATYPDAFASGRAESSSRIRIVDGAKIVVGDTFPGCSPPAPKRSRGAEVAEEVVRFSESYNFGSICSLGFLSVGPSVSGRITFSMKEVNERVAMIRSRLAAAIDAEIASAEERGRKGEREAIIDTIVRGSRLHFPCHGDALKRITAIEAGKAVRRDIEAQIRART